MIHITVPVTLFGQGTYARANFEVFLLWKRRVANLKRSPRTNSVSLNSPSRVSRPRRLASGREVRKVHVPSAQWTRALVVAGTLSWDESVSQSVSYFTVPPRAHPSTGSQSGSTAPVLTQGTEYSLPGRGGYTRKSDLGIVASAEVNLSLRTGCSLSIRSRYTTALLARAYRRTNNTKFTKIIVGIRRSRALARYPSAWACGYRDSAWCRAIDRAISICRGLPRRRWRYTVDVTPTRRIIY